jgi:hypothetical protein
VECLNRKEIRQLSEDELQAYFDTVWAMKETGRQDGRGYLNYYDDFVAQVLGTALLTDCAFCSMLMNVVMLDSMRWRPQTRRWTRRICSRAS